MYHILRLSALALLVSLPASKLTALPLSSEQDPVAVLAIPAGLTGFPGDTLVVPVFVSTLMPIASTQIVVEFDDKDFQFIAATAGPHANGFGVTSTTPASIPVATPLATKNTAVRISGGSRVLLGSDLNVLFLSFKIVGAPGGASPFAFNADSSATFLTTPNQARLHSANLQLNGGSGTIVNLASLSIPGGFSAPKAETLFVPVRLSSAKPLGVAQMVIEYDGSDLEFVDAKPGPDADDFAVLVEKQLNFAPTAPGTNRNVLVSLFSGSSAIEGSERSVATLIFLASGEVGGNSPIAFDQQPQHTVLSTTELVELTGSDLAFRNGDATILPSLVTLRGKIFYRNSTAPVSGGAVVSIGPTRLSVMSDESGNYVLRRLAQGSYIVRPLKTGDLRGAIQASDALLVLRAAASLDVLDADQKFCADVTRDGRITVSDALAILRFIAAQSTGIAQVGIWVFQPESVNLLLLSNAEQNFKTLLLGEVSGNWATAANSNESKMLPFATVQFGPPRQDGDKVYLPLMAGNDGRVFTLRTSLALPEDVANSIRFEPVTTDIISVSNYDTTQNWHLVLVDARGVAPQEKIGDLVLPRTAADKWQNWKLENTEVNDWRTQITGVDAREEPGTIPTAFELQQNYPNPFSGAARSRFAGNPMTWITFAIPARAGETEVRLEIFSIDGRFVRSLVQGKYAPGTHRVQWDGRDEIGAAVPTGVYFYRIRADKFSASRKLALVK